MTDRKLDLIAVFLLPVMLAGCSATPQQMPESGLQLQAYQANEFSTTKRLAFSAIMSVFQDHGFIIDDGDFETGLITATGPTLDTAGTVPDWLSILMSGRSLSASRHQRATAYVETMPSGSVRIRLNLVFTTQYAPGGGIVIVEPVDDPGVYRQTFADIDKAIFIRTQAI